MLGSNLKTTFQNKMRIISKLVKYMIGLMILLSISCATNVGDTNMLIYPSFGFETDVAINGLAFDAMEPFISADGMYLFFNNLNDGINTSEFAVDIVDTEEKELSWRGIASDVVRSYSNAEALQEELDYIVAAMLEDFPPNS